MSTWLLLLLLSAALLGLCIAALSLRHTLGLGPLMLVMGALEALKTYVLTGLMLDLPGLGVVRVGSVVSYMVALTVVQVLYLRCGLQAARQLGWTLVGIAVALALLGPLIAWLMQQPGVQAPLPVAASHLAVSGRIEAVGNLLLLAGLLGGVALVNALQRWGLGRFGSLLLTLLVVASTDTLLFLLVAFGPEALDGAGAAVAGKAAMAVWLATLAYAYLRASQGEREGRVGQRPGTADLLAALSFRRELNDMEQRLLTDPLTGAFNRAYLEQAVPEILKLDQLRGVATSMVMLDLDHFQLINDRRGYLIGDESLRQATRSLRSQLRQNDTVVRLGGDRFLVVLPCTTASEAERLTRGMLAALREPEAGDSSPLGLQATAGVATSPLDGLQLRTLLHQAELRLEAGKRAGRDRVVSPA